MSSLWSTRGSSPPRTCPTIRRVGAARTSGSGAGSTLTTAPLPGLDEPAGRSSPLGQRVPRLPVPRAGGPGSIRLRDARRARFPGSRGPNAAPIGRFGPPTGEENGWTLRPAQAEHGDHRQDDHGHRRPEQLALHHGPTVQRVPRVVDGYLRPVAPARLGPPRVWSIWARSLPPR